MRMNYTLDLNDVTATLGPWLGDICQTCSLSYSYAPETFTGIVAIGLFCGEVRNPLSPMIRNKIKVFLEDARQLYNELSDQVHGNISFRYEGGVLKEVILVAE